MTVTLWFVLLQSYVLAMASPGPDIIILMRMAARSRADALRAALGIIAGNLVWIFVSVFGLTAVMSSHVALTVLVQVIGAVILAHMGQQMVRAGWARRRDGSREAEVTLADRPFRSGLMTNLANAKAAIFYGAFLAAFIPPGAALSTQVGIVVAMSVLCLIWFVLVAVVLSLPTPKRILLRVGPYIDLAGGVVFLALAVGIVLSVLF